jgi:ABC-type polysaccharide/polyol phosphate export permease
MLRTFCSAWQDIRAGLRMRHVWTALAREDIGDQHRRTTLGPLWLLINYVAFAGTFIFLFKPGDDSILHYPAYVATGLFVWFYIMETTVQSVTLFIREEAFLKGTPLPITVYVMRLLMQSGIRASYALLGCIALVLLSGTPLSAGSAWALLGAAVIAISTPAAIIIFAFFGAYFPDSQFLVANLMRLGMFLTPIFWGDSGEGGIRSIFYHWNPFTYLVEVVRGPIINGYPTFEALFFTLAITAVLWLLALALLGTFRKKVVFVL